MLEAALKKIFRNQREIFLREAAFMKGFMALLMKHRNTGQKWTIEEKAEIRRNIARISRLLPALFIFMLPGGMLLLPILAMILDRRTRNRTHAS